MAKLSSKERAALPDRAFAYIDARGNCRLPINDESCVRNALARFDQVAFEDEAARERARMRLLNAAKKYGIVPVGFITGQLKSERRKTEQIHSDLKEAQKIQAGLLPRLSPSVPGFAMSGVCRPSRSVGGDWYDYIQFPDGRVAIVLADVSGKGMAAALLMSSTRSILRLVAQDDRAPSDVLAEVNRTLVADLPASRFITMIYAVLDPARRIVTFANAGHHPPILVEKDGARLVKARAELALGVRQGEYTEQTVEMGPESRLFLYSDGVVEARNRAKEEYGEARLLEFVGSNAVTAEQLLKDVLGFTGSRTVQDDITIVAVCR